MQQLDMFDSSKDFYFITQLDGLSTSCRKQFKASFAMITEALKEIDHLKDIISEMRQGQDETL